MSGRGKLLTVAVPISQHTLSAGYKMAELAHTVDFVNVMAYDYHGPWETFTGHNAPMYSDDDLNVVSTIHVYGLIPGSGIQWTFNPFLNFIRTYQ